jgi:hypothetical protein
MGGKALDRRAGDHREGDALVEMLELAVDRVDERRAQRAWSLDLRAVHEAVQQQRVAPGAEQLRQPHRAHHILAARALLEQIVARNHSSGGQRPPLCGHLLGVPSQLDLSAQQLLASGAVLL